MHCLSLRLNLVLGLDLILAHAQPDNFLSTPNEPVDKTYLNSDEFTSSVPDFALNQSNQGETGFLVDANDPFASTNVLNLITLSDSCGTEDSLTNGVLRARDGTPCASQEDQVDLPIGLFQDPEGYLRENLPAPPVGQTGQSGQENKEDGDLGFAAFMRNRLRPVSISPESNEQICDPKKFGISNTPMCSNPFTGSVARDTSFSFMLLDAVPYAYGDECLDPSELWCCADIRIQLRRSGPITSFLFTPEQLQFLARLNSLQVYDAYYCFNYRQG